MKFTVLFIGLFLSANVLGESKGGRFYDAYTACHTLIYTAHALDRYPDSPFKGNRPLLEILPLIYEKIFEQEQHIKENCLPEYENYMADLYFYKLGKGHCNNGRLFLEHYYDEIEAPPKPEFDESTWPEECKPDIPPFMK